MSGGISGTLDALLQAIHLRLNAPPSPNSTKGFSPLKIINLVLAEELHPRGSMAYVITDTCTKDELCVEACPVDCIHPKKDEPRLRNCRSFTSIR